MELKVEEVSPGNRNIILIIKEKIRYARKQNYLNIKGYHKYTSYLSCYSLKRGKYTEA